MKTKFLFALLIIVLGITLCPAPPPVYPPGRGGGGGTGGVYSNDTRTAVIATFYTNNTPHYIDGIARLGYSGAGTLTVSVTNSDNTRFFPFVYDALSVGATSNSLPFKVPPGGWWKFSGTGSTATDGTQVLTYNATNGAVTYATTAGNAATVTDGATQAGLAAGSYAIKPTALTGILNWTSTNTVNVGSSNAITVVSNATSWASVAFSGASAVSRGFNLTFYATSDPLVFTNGATSGFFCAGGFLGDTIILTNATYPDAAGDGSDTAAINGSQENFPNFDDSQWIDNNVDANPLTVVSTETFIYSPLHAKVNADLSDSFNIPLPTGGLTNNWKASNPAVYITNTVYVQKLYGFSPGFELNVDYAAPYTQPFIYLTNNLFKFSGGSSAFQFVWGPTANSYIDFNNGTSAYGFLMRSKIGVGIECPSDQGVIRLTDDHRTDGIVKLAGQLVGADTGRYVTNNFSGMLGFQSFGGTDGSPLTGMAGIRAKNAAGAAVYNQGGVDLQHSELWLYTLIPPQLSNSLGGFRIVGDTNWFAIGVTNSTIVKGLTIVSNPVSLWPTAPRTPGDTYFGNSNGIIYALYSGVAATWVKTNLISGP